MWFVTRCRWSDLPTAPSVQKRRRSWSVRRSNGDARDRKEKPWRKESDRQGRVFTGWTRFPDRPAVTKPLQLSTSGGVLERSYPRATALQHHLRTHSCTDCCTPTMSANRIVASFCSSEMWVWSRPPSASATALRKPECLRTRAHRRALRPCARRSRRAPPQERARPPRRPGRLPAGSRARVSSSLGNASAAPRDGHPRRCGPRRWPHATP